MGEAVNERVEAQIAATIEASDKHYRNWFNAQPGLHPRNKMHPRVDVAPYKARIAELEAEVAWLKALAAPPSGGGGAGPGTGEGEDRA